MATTQVDLTIRIVKFTKSHFHNNQILIQGQDKGDPVPIGSWCPVEN